jgi:hypothetical protein
MILFKKQMLEKVLELVKQELTIIENKINYNNKFDLLESVVAKVEDESFHVLINNYFVINLVIIRGGLSYPLCKPFKINMLIPYDINIDNLINVIKWNNNINFYTDKEDLSILMETYPKTGCDDYWIFQ